MRSRPSQVVLLILLLAAVVPVVAQEGSAEDEAIQRILELERQIEALEAGLSPAARDRLERRRAGMPDPVEEAPSEPVPPAEAEPEPVASLASPPEVAPSDVVPSAEAVVPPADPPRRRLRRPTCNFLELLDENEDGRLTALDRHWRHLYVWSDKNRDRQAQENEVESVYARNIREISTRLTTFVRKKGTVGDVRHEEFLHLDVRGDGFGGSDDGVLVVDATRLQRGAGPELLSAAGEVLQGFQPLQEGLKVRLGDGEPAELTCR